MKHVHASVLISLILATMAGMPLLSQEHDEEEEPEATLYEERIEVQAAAQAALDTEELDLDILDTGRAPNLAVAAGSLAGLSGIRRAHSAFEPVVRGLGWERVQTQVNGMPLYCACPARMDPPACSISVPAARSVSVAKGLASVASGPSGTGGRIDVTTDYDRGAGAGKTVDPWLRLSHGSAVNGMNGNLGVKGGTDRIDYAAGASFLDQNDYETAKRVRIPAGHRERGTFLTFAHRATDSQRWFISGLLHEARETAYPSLPMDSERVDTSIYTAGYRYRPADRNVALSELEVSLGLAEGEHLMSNRLRANRPLVEAEANSSAKSHSIGLSTRWKTSPSSELEGGFDFNALERDALRERRMVASGITLYDHLWPDVSQEALGLYAEYSVLLASSWNLRLGLRHDRVSSREAAADDRSLFGGSAREWYIYFYGEDAATTKRREGLWSGNLLLTKKLGTKVTLQGGLGVVARAAGMTERYFAFALSPIGYLVGNPTLAAEKKREIAVSADFEGKYWKGTFSGYHYAIDDFILPTSLGIFDLDSDGAAEEHVSGYENSDATLTGFDIAFVCRPSAHWSFPASLSYVRGRDKKRGLPLPEIPPLEGGIAGRWYFPGSLTGWVELGGRFVAAATRVDPDFPENETSGFGVWHLRGRFDVSRHLAIEAGVENLFNEEYWEHLTREAAANLPGFEPGQEIPQPGRFVTVALILDI